MARPARTGALTTTHHVRAWRKVRGLTLEQLADAIGMSHQNLGRIERGLVPLGGEHHQRLADALGVQPPDLFRDPDDVPAGEAMVPIIGLVGADNEGTVVYTTAHATGDMAPIPPGGTRDSVALEVRGHSMRGFADDGALLYFDRQRTPPGPEMLGYVVVVETEGDQVLVKRLLKGSRPGLYDLESQVGPTLSDVRLRWAAEITAIIPARHAQRVIRRRGEAA